MLDRKTKDIDADVELLEDRKKNNALQFVLIAIFGATFMIAGVYYHAAGDWFYMDFFLLVAAIMFIVSAYSLIVEVQYNMLLFYKKYMKVK